MPEYLAPGVYVEETSFRSKSVEGVSTTTTGFIGPTRFGPPGVASDVLTSLADFERVYGDGQPLTWAPEAPNYMWHAVRAFFENGGRRAYVARTWYLPAGTLGTGYGTVDGTTTGLELRARFPGAAGNLRVRFQLRPGKDARVPPASNTQSATITGVAEGDLVVRVEGTEQQLCVVAKAAPDTSGRGGWALLSLADRSQTVSIPLGGTGDTGVYPLKVTVSVLSASGSTLLVKDGCNPLQLNEVFAQTPARQADALTLPIIITAAPVAALSGSTDLLHPAPREYSLLNGSDGGRPTTAEYAGASDEGVAQKAGLAAFEALEDISIVAAPGSTTNPVDDARSISGLLLSHCERMRYRIAVLDSVPGSTVGDVRKWRAVFDSSHGALYYPWVRVMDPISRREIVLPPSGFIAGIYARNDNLRAVHKAPANEVVQLAIGFETTVNQGQQEVLNPEGINCLRFFEGRGLRVWGARTLSSDPEWKYVNLRRYFAYLERSIDRGTQWAVFESNGPALWSNVKRTIEDFLLNEFQSGALLGDRPERACFVKCDRSTMSQNDLDNGRLVCHVGVSPLRPAEFVIFRIGQWTADARN